MQADLSAGRAAAVVPGDGASEAGAVWALLLELRRRSDGGDLGCGPCGFSLVEGCWRADAPERADLVIDPARAELKRAALAPGTLELLELHLAHALCPPGRGHVIALLGQSLDGFIATRDGHSRYINGEPSLVHLHRLRALSDAVLIGIGTALADAPRLTTRHVAGPDAVRVVIDPRARLPADSGLLHDGGGPTLVLRGCAGPSRETRLSAQATAIEVPVTAHGIDPALVLKVLAERGLTRVLIEGGGCTVGRFLEAGLLDRLQLAVSPLILGGGRPALPVTPARRLEDALRPAARRYILGEDVLFDLSPRAGTLAAGSGPA